MPARAAWLDQWLGRAQQMLARDTTASPAARSHAIGSPCVHPWCEQSIALGTSITSIARRRHYWLDFWLLFANWRMIPDGPGATETNSRPAKATLGSHT